MSSASLGLFPGQGSQVVGMGIDFFDNTPLAKEIFKKADQALGFSLSDICFNGPSESLTLTAHAQPAILTVSTIAYELVKHSTPLKAAIGHSLGEYSALVAAQALDFEEAVVLVHKRGTYMQDAVPAGQGMMLAILGQEVEKIEDLLASVTEGVAEIANVNAPGQVVVSGDVVGMTQLQALLAGIKYKTIPVSAPFHSSLMRTAAERLSEDLKHCKIVRPNFPVYSNFFAKPLEDPERIREALYLQVCGRVRFTECVEDALQTFSVSSAFEFGTGKVLSGLIKRCTSAIKCTGIGDVTAVNAINNEQLLGNW